MTCKKSELKQLNKKWSERNANIMMNSIYTSEVILYCASRMPLGSFYELLAKSEVISGRFNSLAPSEAVYILRVEECGVPLASQNPH